MMALCLGLLLFQGEPSPEAIRRWIDDLNVESVLARDTAMRKLIEAGESARSAVQALADSPDLEARARAREILRYLDGKRQVRGQKVLFWFHAYPVGSMEKGSDNTEAHEKVAREIQDALAKAGAKPLELLHDSRQSKRRHENPKQGAVHVDQLILVDCQGRKPEDVFEGLPHRRGGIVFEDGAYARGLADPLVKQGNALPGRYASMLWGSGETVLRDEDLKRYRSQRGVAVQLITPPVGSGGSLGWVKLTPEPGTTLLEVFLLTRAQFGYFPD